MTNYWAGVRGKGNTVELFQDGGQIKRGKGFYHHGPRPISIICYFPDTLCFSLVTSFNSIKKWLTQLRMGAAQLKE
jgi:hypothetical protein